MKCERVLSWKFAPRTVDNRAQKTRHVLRRKNNFACEKSNYKFNDRKFQTKV
jgi:hypothetical protein